jgi:hypothetical protein
MYPVLSAEEVDQIVKGGAEAVDRIMGPRNKQDSVPVDEDGPEDSAPQSSQPAPSNNSQALSGASMLAKSEPAPQEQLASTGSDSSKPLLDKNKFLRDLGL